MNSDLISRESLKEEVKTLFCPDGYKIMMLERIDNAPTVKEKSYAMGYQDGLEDGLDGIRPQGEWILMYCSCGDRYYSCSICNRVIEVQNGQSLKDYPFCHCGADMRKGGAE